MTTPDYTITGVFLGRLDVDEAMIEYTNGDVYQGTLRDMQMTGQGNWACSSGGWVYQGEFLCGKFHGFGVHRFDAGIVYEGEFLQGPLAHSRYSEEYYNLQFVKPFFR